MYHKENYSPQLTVNNQQSAASGLPQVILLRKANYDIFTKLKECVILNLFQNLFFRFTQIVSHVKVLSISTNKHFFNLI